MVVTLVVLGFMAFLFVVFGTVFLKGKGFEMISMPESRKAEWDKRILCRFMGRFMIFMAFDFLLIMSGIYLRQRYLEMGGLILLAVGSVYVIMRLLLPVKEKYKTK